MIPGLVVPPTVELDVHARVPAHLAVTDRPSVWGVAHRGTPDVPSFIEGPVLTDDGGLLLADVARGRILRVSGPGRVDVVIGYDGEPNGLALTGPRRLLVADYEHGLLAIDDLDQPTAPVPFVGRYGPERFRGLNDLVVADDGRVFFTDQGATGLHDPTGRVLCAHPDGRLDLVLDGVPSPNGIVWHPASSTLFVAVTRDNAVWRVPLGANGRAHKVGRFLQLSAGVGPDGLALGPDGTLLVAHLGLGVVWVFDRRGLPVLALQAPEGLATTNVTVGPDGRAYVTESETGTVLTTDLGRHLHPGRPREGPPPRGGANG